MIQSGCSKPEVTGEDVMGFNSRKFWYQVVTHSPTHSPTHSLTLSTRTTAACMAARSDVSTSSSSSSAHAVAVCVVIATRQAAVVALAMADGSVCIANMLAGNKNWKVTYGVVCGVECWGVFEYFHKETSCFDGHVIFDVIIYFRVVVHHI